MEVMVPTYSVDCPETITNLPMALVSGGNVPQFLPLVVWDRFEGAKCKTHVPIELPPGSCLACGSIRNQVSPGLGGQWSFMV